MINRITDSGFDINRTKEYILSIQVSLDGFSFCIIQENQKKLIALENFPVTISSSNFLGRRFIEWAELSGIFFKEYAKINLLYCSELFTVIPGKYYDYEKQNTTGHLLFGKKDNYTIKDTFLPDLKSNLLFLTPDSLFAAFDNIFPEHTFIHPVSVLAQKINARTLNEKNVLVLFFRQKSFYLLFFNKGKLVIANSYSFFHPTDTLYYVLTLLKQHSVNPINTKLFLSGEIILGDELHKSFENYFKVIEFPIPDINFSPERFKVPMHRFITLC